MIALRAFAQHLVSLNPVLHAFKDELAWTQAGEPWPCLLVTKLGERLAVKGTGRYDRRELDAITGKWVYEKLWTRRMTLRLTIRSAAAGGKSGVTIVDKVCETIRALIRRHATGLPLDLVDAETGEPVHLERIRLITESDQGPLLSRVPFEAQSTLDVELWATVADVVEEASAMESVHIILN
jgi:hypothetical protein